MATAITNNSFVLDQDSSIAFSSQTTELKNPLQALNYQLKWGTNVRGNFIYEGSLFPSPYDWETVVNCEEIKVPVSSGPSSMIVSLSGVWMTLGFVRFRWEPDPGGSSDLINCALRIVPV